MFHNIKQTGEVLTNTLSRVSNSRNDMCVIDIAWWLDKRKIYVAEKGVDRRGEKDKWRGDK